MGKRAATAMAAPTPKFAKIVKAIQAAEVPPSTREMMVSLLQPALGPAKDQRHAYQHAAVEMISAMLHDSQAALAKAVVVAEAAVSSDAEEQQRREEGVHAADARLKEKQEEMNQKKHVLADHARAFKSARESLKHAEAEGEALLKAAEESLARKAQLESEVPKLADPLKQGSAASTEVVGLVTELCKLLTSLGLDSGMIVALPNALAKSPGERGSFDLAVVQSLDEEVAKHVATCDRKLKESEPQRAELTAAKQRAEAALAAATQAQQDSAEAFLAARAEAERAEEALSQAQQELKSAQQDAKRHVRELAAASKNLQAFRDGPLAAFVELRDQETPPPPQEQPQSEEAPAADVPMTDGLPDAEAAPEAAAPEAAAPVAAAVEEAAPAEVPADVDMAASA